MDQQHINLTFFKEDILEKEGQFQLPIYWWNALWDGDRSKNNRKDRIIKIAATVYAKTQSELIDLANLFCDAKRKKEAITTVFEVLKQISIAVPADVEFDNFASELEGLTSHSAFHNVSYGDHYPDFMYHK